MTDPSEPGRLDRERPAPAEVVRVNGPLVEVEGLAPVAVADVIEVGAEGLAAEVVSVRQGLVTAQVYEYTGGLRVGAPAVALGRPLSARLGPGLLGGIFDGLFRPLAGRPAFLAPGALAPAPQRRRWSFAPANVAGADGAAGSLLGVVRLPAGLDHRVLVPAGVGGPVEWIAEAGELAEDEPVAVVGGRPVTMVEHWPVRRPRPVRARLGLQAPLLTGQRVLDLLFPVAKGGTAAVPGGFGTGKTMLLQQIVKWCDADVIVFVGCGERGNEIADALEELAELDDPRTGRGLLERTVVIANTSNMPVMAREASIYTGMTVAEFFRDMGYDVVLLADSTSRWAEALAGVLLAHRRAARRGGLSGRLASALAAFYERAGAGRHPRRRGGLGHAIGAVSPPGGDMTEPVTAHTERFVRCLWSLDRDLAYARHYPAVTWHRSFCRDADAIGAWHAGAGRVDWARHRRGRSLCSPRPTGSHRSSSSSGCRRCRPASGSCCSPAGCCARRCSSRAR